MLRRILATLGKIAIASAGLLAALWLFGERGHILRPSTRALLEEMGGWRALGSLKFWEAYVYARWSNQYIGWAIKVVFPRVDPTNAGHLSWAGVYHGKVLRTEDAKRLISIEQPIPHQNLEQVIPFEIARDIVLSAPPEIAVYECPCRASREHPCQPTQVCMIVGQPFVDFILEHNPTTSRRLSTEEAVDLLAAEHARGHVHTAYFKDVMLGRFYAICNCCTCCCGGIEAMRSCGVPMVIASGYVAQVDADRCAVCGDCEAACPFEAITVNGEAVVDAAACLGCGVCESQCPQEAITLVRDDSKPAPLDVRTLA